MVRLLLPILLVSPLCASPSQDLRLSGMFADHMVLQRETTAPVWGWAAAGAEVSVKPSWSAEAVLAKADGEGAWRADLSTPKAGGPYTLSVTAGKTITLEDVMVGEVWICSGQSNMEWHLSWFADATATINSIDEPQLRLCTVGKAFSDTAKGDASISWGLCTPAAAADFSAVGFHFGRELAQALPDMPIGLVMTAWGGTVVEAWTSEAALRLGGEFDSALDLVAARRAGHSLV
ncbi:MAG: sialate O-acetylesterase, partial [Planctomycetota bacterium]|nr:sialate O-acetylesterase [Planctomycetota bacterium]